MKLFEKFDAVRFPEENLIFITRNEYIYYIYDPEENFWRKHRRAGNDSITVSHYQDVSRDELIAATGGLFPTKEADFMRLCPPSQLSIWDMQVLLGEDYPSYMTDHRIRHAAHRLLLQSRIRYKSYLRLRALFDEAIAGELDNQQALAEIKRLSFDVIGRDIFKLEIGIVDGHDSSSYFWIMPVRVVDVSNTDSMDCVAEMKSNEISIEENDIAQYLTPFLYKHFDDELDANKQRIEERWIDEDGVEHSTPIRGFGWNLTYNFFTFESIHSILDDIHDTVDALLTGRENEYTAKLREKRGWATYQMLYARDLSEEQIKEYNDNRPTKDDTEISLIVDFYQRFLYRMEYMLKVGKEKGYNLISFMGP